MPHLDYLRPSTGKVITTAWGTAVVDLIENMGIDQYGYLHSDLIPDVDVALKLGIPIKRFKEVHAQDAYFKSLAVDDPIFIQSRMQVLDGKVNESITENAKIFTGDLEVLMDGRVRVQVRSDVDNSLYLYHTHTGFAGEDFSFLDSLIASKLLEKDVTTQAYDYLNLMVSSAANMTLLLYNIGNL
jgi:hypothetical protein